MTSTYPDDHDDYDDYDDYDLDDDDDGYRREASVVTRRRFLAGLAVSGAAGYGAFVAVDRGTGTPAANRAASTTVPPAGATTVSNQRPGPPVPTETPDDGLLHPAPVDERILVLIELEGGNDGPSTVVPAGAGTYYDLRPNMAIADQAVLSIDDQVGLNPNLARLHARQLGIVEGVGPVEGSLSHFEMVARWEQGDLLGDNRLRTGFLARLADELDDGSGAVVGLSAGGFTPRFNNVTAPTLSLDNLGALRVLTKDDWIFPAYRRAVTSFSGGPMTTTVDASYDRLIQIGNSLPGGFGEIDTESPMVTEGRELGKQLATAIELLRADIGVRVVHARLGGFDTHDGHQWRHEALMTQLDAAVDGFCQLLATHGLTERVLVATSSEFGRRVGENGSGLDHGAASTMLLVGPVVPGRHGEPSSLGDLDQHGNLRTTVPFDSYLGTLAEWLGVDAGSVLPTEPEPLSVI